MEPQTAGALSHATAWVADPTPQKSPLNWDQDGYSPLWGNSFTGVRILSYTSPALYGLNLVWGPMESVELGIAPDDEQLDYNWVTDRLAVGGAIWNPANMRQLAKVGITHIVDLQTFDDTKIAEGTGISVLWCPFRDDLEVKEPKLFKCGVDFALAAYQFPKSRIYIHCEQGVHRSPMMLLAVLGALGMKLTEAMELIQKARPQAEFPAPYRQSIIQFVAAYRDRTSQ